MNRESTESIPWWKKLVSGLTDHSLVVVLSGSALALLILFFLELSLTKGWFYQIDQQWLLADRNDDWTQVMVTVNKLPASQLENHLVLLGGSGSRESLISDRTVADALTSSLNNKWHFVNLGAHNQTYAQAIALIDNLPPAKSSAIIFATSPYFIAADTKALINAYQGVRLPIPSVELTKALKVLNLNLPAYHPLSILRYRPKVANYLRKRLTKGTLFRPIDYQLHRYADLPMASDAKLAHLGKLLARLPADYRNMEQANFTLLEKAILLAKSKNYDVILCELPRNPALEQQLYGANLPSYLTATNHLAERQQIPFLNLHDRLNMDRDFFVDQTHFTDSGRQHFQPHFVSAVVSLLNGGNR